MCKLTKSLSTTLVLCIIATGSVAQTNNPVGFFGLGDVPTERQISGWDIDVRPDGLGLPSGAGSVADGDDLFQEQCAQCHGVFGEGAGRWPVLVGGEDTLTDDRPEKTIGSYWPYATTLWDYIHRAMPFFNPQSLSNNEVYALTAFLLNMNGIVDDDFVAHAGNLAAVEMPNRHGFTSDPRPDSPAGRCMSDCKDPATIEVTWDASTLGVTPIDHLIGQNQFATAPAEPSPGVAVYQSACGACHTTGVAGAPKIADKNAWVGRVGQGIDTLVEHAINGYHGKAGYMPPKGGQLQLSDADVAAAVRYIVDQSSVTDESL